MQLRKLGNTGQTVSAIGFGGGAISGEGRGYGFGPIGERDATRLLHGALEAGITVYDLAPVYGFGLAEERVGRAFSGTTSQGSLREKVFIVSKSGITWDERKRIRQDNRPEIAVSMLNESLKRLKTDYIDLYMIHWPEGSYGKNDAHPLDLAQTLDALNSEREAGKIRFLGLCNFTPEQIDPLLGTAPISVLQNEWNYWTVVKRPEQAEALRRFCRTHGMGLMGWGTLDKGILSGRVTPNREFDRLDARSWAPWWVQQDLTWKFEALRALEPELKSRAESLLQFALNQALKASELSTALVGVRSLDQLRTLLAALSPPAI